MLTYECNYCNSEVPDLGEHYEECDQRDSMRPYHVHNPSLSELELNLKNAVRLNQEPRTHEIK